MLSMLWFVIEGGSIYVGGGATASGNVDMVIIVGDISANALGV